MNLNKGISTPIAILIVVILASLIGGVIYWQQSEQAKFVSFSELTSNSQQYNNEVITTEGFYIGAFETSVLSPTIEFSEGGLPQSRAPNRIWIGELGPDVLEQLYSPQNKGPKVIYGKIRITGRFNTGNEFGHLGSYKHLLSDIRQVKVLTWSPPEQARRTWVEIDPIQCLGNSWEVDWLKSHNNDYSSYPRDLHTSELEPEEIEIIKDYYRRQGITIFEVNSEQTYETVCEACSCPQGYTLYLLISKSDLNKMLDLGYEISE